MATYMDKETGLPHASYDLWEQLFLTHTFTSSIVFSALTRAAEYVGKSDARTTNWLEASSSIKANIGKLFSEKDQWFVRGLKPEGGNFEQLEMLDIASLYGIATYGPSDPNDTAVYATRVAIEANNVIKGGVIRYRGDDYMRVSTQYSANPWYVATSWLAQYYAKVGDDQSAKNALDWTLTHVTSSGMLSEQVDPDSGEPRGVSPLVWSHAEYLSTLIAIFGKKD